MRHSLVLILLTKLQAQLQQQGLVRVAIAAQDVQMHRELPNSSKAAMLCSQGSLLQWCGAT